MLKPMIVAEALWLAAVWSAGRCWTVRALVCRLSRIEHQQTDESKQPGPQAKVTRLDVAVMKVPGKLSGTAGLKTEFVDQLKSPAFGSSPYKTIKLFTKLLRPGCVPLLLTSCGVEEPATTSTLSFSAGRAFSDSSVMLQWPLNATTTAGLHCGGFGRVGHDRTSLGKGASRWVRPILAHFATCKRFA